MDLDLSADFFGGEADTEKQQKVCVCVCRGVVHGEAVGS